MQRKEQNEGSFRESEMCIDTKTYSLSMQMNLPVSVLPSESVVLIRLPRRNDLVYSKDSFRRSLIEASSNAAGAGGD